MKLPWLSLQAENLGQLLDQQRLGHAPLLHGPAGVGKSELAHWLVARILCVGQDAPRPCGVCRSCRLLEAGSHPDLFVATVPEDKTQITVDIIRDLSAGLQLTPSMGPHRVGLVEPAESMNTNAANALLKTLEEPSASAWLVLVSHRPDLLPATVRSRCQKLAIRAPQRDVALSWLQRTLPAAATDQIDLALDISGDAPLKALSLLESDGLSFGLEVRQVLLDLAAGRAVQASTADAWSARAQECWVWIAHWIRQWMGPLARDQAAGSVPALPGDGQSADLARAWQRALEGRQLADTAVRADLLLGKWLLEWRSIFAAGP